MLRHRPKAGREASELSAGARGRVAARTPENTSVPAGRNVPSITSRTKQGLRCYYGRLSHYIYT